MCGCSKSLLSLCQEAASSELLQLGRPLGALTSAAPRGAAPDFIYLRSIFNRLPLSPCDHHEELRHTHRLWGSSFTAGWIDEYSNDWLTVCLSITVKIHFHNDIFYHTRSPTTVFFPERCVCDCCFRILWHHRFGSGTLTGMQLTQMWCGNLNPPPHADVHVHWNSTLDSTFWGQIVFACAKIMSNYE